MTINRALIPLGDVIAAYREQPTRRHAVAEGVSRRLVGEFGCDFLECPGQGYRLRLSLVTYPTYLSPATTRTKSVRLHQIPTSSRAAQGHILVPVGCAAGLLQLERELRARQRIGTAGVTLGWRRLSPSAELFVDPESGKRCAVRDPGALGAERAF